MFMDSSRDWSHSANLTEALVHVLKSLSGATLVIDGLDESPQQHEIVDFLDNLHQLSLAPKILGFTRETEVFNEQIYVTSDQRYIVREADVEQDIMTFIAHEIKIRKERGKPARFRVTDTNTEDQIVQTLKMHSRGSFLWISCILDEVCQARTDELKKEALHDLPETMNGVYDRMRDRILTMTKNETQLATCAISWLLHSKRPLTLAELAIAVPFSPETKLWTPKNALTDPHVILYLCAGFAVQRGNSVYILHFSASQYLLSDRALKLRSKPESQFLLLQNALSFIIVDTEYTYEVDREAAFLDEVRWRRGFFEEHYVPAFLDMNDTDTDVTTCDWQETVSTFTDYCITYWPDHALECDRQNLSYTLFLQPLLQNQGVFEPWLLKWLDIRRGVLNDLRRDIIAGDYAWPNVKSDFGDDFEEKTWIPSALLTLSPSDISTLLAFLGLQEPLLQRLSSLPWQFKKNSFLGGSSPLHGAAAGKHAELCKQLLTCGFDPNILNQVHQTPLLLAAQVGSYAVGAVLLSNGADKHCRDAMGFTALHYLASEDWSTGNENRRIQFARTYYQECTASFSLLAPTIPPRHACLITKPRNASGGNPITLTANAMVGWRLGLDATHDIGIEGQGAPGSSTTYYVITRANTEANQDIKRLLNVPTRSLALTPIQHAINNKQIDLLQAYLEFGADPNGLDGDGYRPLHKACRQASWNPRALEILINFGADVNGKDERGRTALHYAVVVGEVNAAGILLTRGADADVQDYEDSTALHMLCNAGCLMPDDDRRAERSLEVLLNHKPNLSIKNKEGFSALAIALLNNWHIGARSLIVQGATLTPDEGMDCFFTVLHSFMDDRESDANAKFPHETLTLLFDNGATFDSIHEIHGVYPLNAAVSVGDTDLVDFYLDRGASLSKLGPSDLLPIFLVLASPRITSLDIRIHIATSLLTAGANPNESQQEMTPLSYIVMMMGEGKAKLAQLFMSFGADVLWRMDTGQSLLDLAEQYGNEEVELIEFLRETTTSARHFDLLQVD